MGAMALPRSNRKTAPYPAHPSIDDTVLDKLGWEIVNRRQEVRDESKWSITEIQSTELRSAVRDATNGVVDLPFASIVAFRIGAQADWFDASGEFRVPWLSKRLLHGTIADQFERHIRNLAPGFSVTGEPINWGLVDPTLPPSVGFLKQHCNPSTTINSIEAGKVSLNQYAVEYELTNSTVNDAQIGDLARTATLDFHAWLGGWTQDGRITTVSAIHPKTSGRVCGLGEGSLSTGLSTALGEPIDFEVEGSLSGEVHTLMGLITS